MVDKIKKNYEEILNDIKEICGENNNVKVVCASKYTDGEGLISLINAGVLTTGENRVQAMKEKKEFLDEKKLSNKLSWHYIGTLQKNKIKYIIDYIDLIQSVHEYSLLEELNKKAQLGNMPKKEILFTRAEVCEHLHISYATLHRYVNTGIFICHKMGRRSLFNLKEVEDALIKMNV